MKTLPITSPDDPRLTDKVKARFWAKVQKAGPDECWLWKGGIVRKGYGRFAWIDGRNYVAHRISLLLSGQQMPKPEAMGCHKCHNTSCVNPNHLYWGSAKENTHDAMEARRFRWLGEPDQVAKYLEARPRGQNHRSAKITDAQVQEIRKAAAAGERYCIIAKRFGCSPSLISKILVGKLRQPASHCRGLPTARSGPRRGERHPMVVLKQADVLAIRSAYRGGANQYDIAKQYGIAQSHVSQIVRGVIWKHLLTAENGIQCGIPPTAKPA